MRRRGLGRGRPSLIGTAARTAVVAGTAASVAGRVEDNRQARAQAAPAAPAAPVAAPAAPPPPPAAATVDDEMVRQLRNLAELRDAGILTDAEFDAKKSQILGL